MDPKTTGLVLIEFQNDFVTEGGSLHDAVAPVMASTDMLNHAILAADAIRAAGGQVFYQPIVFAPGYNEITDHPYGILAGVVASNSFVKGGWGAEIADPIKPKDGDIVLEGKRGLDAFGSANIDFVLRSKGIRTVVLAGFLTNCCVESTMRTAYEKGFEVITLTDAVAATSQEEHDNAIKYDYPMFSKPMTTTECIEALQGAQVADTSRGY
ncbi:MAG: cysteine hydrolase [Propionibacteriaceae bacterium]|jgi:nicotinamidase-related amidase|nr:cysteine hydrolase [Propionibacteriaceae bacterium]